MIGFLEKLAMTENQFYKNINENTPEYFCSLFSSEKNSNKLHMNHTVNGIKKYASLLKVLHSYI